MIVAPSILSLDYRNTKEQMEALERSHAEFIHFDVMDGHFVPNLSFGPDILKAFKSNMSKVMDVHLMVDDPKFMADIFMKAGADYITFHSEAVHEISNQRALIQHIHECGCKAGISIKPDTCVNNILPILPEVDLVLVMSVYPGFGGQSFIDDSIDKIRDLRDIIDTNGYSCLIEVDGGINLETGRKCAEAGVDILVAGSYTFKGNIEERVDSLWNLK